VWIKELYQYLRAWKNPLKMIVKLNLIRNKSAPHFYQFKLILISYRPTSVASISQSFLLEFKTCLADIHGVYAMCMILRCALKPLPNYNNSLAHIASIIVAYLLIIPEPGCCLRSPRLGAWPPPQVFEGRKLLIHQLHYNLSRLQCWCISPSSSNCCCHRLCCECVCVCSCHCC